ncbi:MAG: hypothetical protein ABR863_04155 [Roseiarcus sp.]|jgi:hypothetical protein
MPRARATITIEKSTLGRLRRAVPKGRRNQFLQGLIERELDEQRERQSRADEALEADNDFTNVGEHEAFWQRRL